MAKSVRVVATAGMTPAILTELGWWTAYKGHRVGSVLVWTTENCLCNVTNHLDAHWDAMRQEVGAELLPARSAIELKVLEGPDSKPLPDVRNAADADAVADQIHRDVRALARDSGPLIGWFAGGRKTMSSALQSAFTLHGRPGDLLLHALVHPKIEKNQEELQKFAWPTEEVAKRVRVELDELVDVATVPFLALAEHMVPEIADESWDGLWQRLGELGRLATDVVATLEAPLPHRARGKRRLRFLQGERCIHTITLSYADADFYARVVSAGDAGTGKPTQHEHTLAHRVREAFGALQYSVLAPFCLQKLDGRGYRVAAHRRVQRL